MSLSWGLEAGACGIGGDVAREDHHRLLVFARDKTEDEDVALSSEVALQDHLVAEEGVAMEHHPYIATAPGGTPRTTRGGCCGESCRTTCPWTRTAPRI